jgi:hypothetical protein
MNSFEIAAVMRRLMKNSSVRFLGVFAFDRMPNPAKIYVYSPCCYIVNTDKSSKKGKHWVAFFHLSARSIEFFDSFGNSPESFGFRLPQVLKTVHNKTQVQGDYSRVCGNYCIYFLYYRSHGYTLKQIIQRLKTRTLLQSDTFIASFIRQVQGKKLI